MITCILVPTFLYLLFEGIRLIYRCNKEAKALQDKINGYPKAKPMSRTDKKELNRLLSLDEHETKIS